MALKENSSDAGREIDDGGSARPRVDEFSASSTASFRPKAREDADAAPATCLHVARASSASGARWAGWPRCSEKAPAVSARHPAADYTRSRGRFFDGRWLLFGRIPFEWVSLVMILAMLVFYILVLRDAPTSVTPALP